MIMSGKKVLGLIVLVCLIVLTSGCTSSNNTNITDTSNESAQGPWHSVKTFTGTGDIVTEPFEIKGEKFKVKITATSAKDIASSNLLIYAFPEGESMYELYKKVKFTKNPEIVEYEVETGPGEFNLKIIADNISNWKVEVFDYY